MAGRDWRRVSHLTTPSDVLAGSLRGEEPRPADGYEHCMVCQQGLDRRSAFLRRTGGPGCVHVVCTPTVN